MSISNPVKLFSGGGSYENQREFKYEGGSKLYHFSPHDNGLSRSMENNLIFFADSESHARDVLRRMLEFAIDCCRKQSDYYNGKGKKSSVHVSEFNERVRDTASAYERYLEKIDTVKLPEAPTNQFYIVGWADNDTIH
jgi:hypothetical protein